MTSCFPRYPNHLFIRDNSCWVYRGVSMNPMAKPARQQESLHIRAVYDYHPMFAGGALRHGVRPGTTISASAARQRGWSQVEDQAVAWLRAADEYVAVSGVIDRGGRVADRTGDDGCLAGVAHSDAA